MKEEIARTTKRVEEATKNEGVLQEEFDEQQKEIAALEAELEAIVQRKKEFEKELKKRQSELKLVIEDEQLEEFNSKYVPCLSQVSNLFHSL